VRKRTSRKTTKTELELAVDVGKNECKVLNWMTRNNNALYIITTTSQATNTKYSLMHTETSTKDIESHTKDAHTYTA